MPGQRRKGAERTIPSHNVDTVTAFWQEEVQAFLRRLADAERFGNFRSLLDAVMSRHRKLCCPEAFMIWLQGIVTHL
jgi:hypothetical protein